MRTLAQPSTLHWVTLAAAAVFLLWVNRHQWFDIDEWAWVADRGVVGSPVLGLLEPHNEHWSTMPIAVWRGLFTVFGVRTYTPYLVVLIGAHLVTAHLLWRLLLRVRVDAYVATLACVPFLVLGAGWENLLQAFQFSVIVPLALGLGALLVMPDRGPLGRRDLIAIAMLVVALTWSGVAVTMVVVVGLFALLTRGVAVAAATVVPPAVVYLAWYAGWGHDVGGRDPDPLTVAIQKLPEFVWEGLTSAVDDVAGVVGVGAVVLVLLGVFVALRIRPQEPADARVLATTVGAVVFLTLTGVRRTSFGIETAGSARYVYVVAALLLPVAALAVDRALRGRPLRATVLVAVTVVLVGVQVSELNDEAQRWAGIEQEQKHRIMAAAELALEDDVFLSLTPAPTFSPDLTLVELLRLDDEDKLPGNVEVTQADRLTALTYLQVTLDRDPRFRDAEAPVVESVRGASLVPGSEAGCVDVVPRSPRARLTLPLTDPASIRVDPAGSGVLEIALRDEEATGRVRELGVGGGVPGWLNVNLTGVSLELGLESTGMTMLCGIDAATI